MVLDAEKVEKNSRAYVGDLPGNRADQSVLFLYLEPVSAAAESADPAGYGIFVRDGNDGLCFVFDIQ